ncbi:hypothetical protein Tco_0499234 [Tanacetum coccineum]
MRTLMVHQGCDAALETSPADMEAGEKAALMKKAYSTLILYLGDRTVSEEVIEDEDQALMLLTSLPSSYENFMETLLYGRESLAMEDVLATLNSRELKKKTEGTKEETSDGLYVSGRWSFEERLSNEEVKWVRQEGRDQDSDYSDDEGNAYFREAVVVVGNDEMTKLVMDSGGSYHMTHKRDFLYDFKVVDGGSVQLGLRRSLISLSTLEKEGYTMKMQMGRVKVIKGYRVMMTGIKKKNCVYTLEAKVMTFGVQKHGGSKQVGLKQLGSKQVGFKQLGPGVETGVHGVHDEKRVWFKVELQGAQGDRKAEVFQVSNDDVAVAQRQLEDKQLKEKTNTDCLVKEQENVHLDKKVGANIMVTGVLGQEGA